MGVRDLSCDIKKCMDGHFKEVRDIRKEDSVEKLWESVSLEGNSAEAWYKLMFSFLFRALAFPQIDFLHVA